MGKITAIVALAVCLALAAVPYESLDCPEWNVTVVTESGQPVAGMTARLVYRDYSAETLSHEVDKTTDQKGHAVFPSQTLRASFFQRGIVMVESARQGVHASFGPHAFVFAFGQGFEGFAVDWNGGPDRMTSRIVVQRSPSAHRP